MTPPHLLVVDDQEPTSRVVKLYLEAKGLRVDVAHSGADAIEACRQGLPDVMLMDVQMPVMDGMETTRRIRALPGADAILIVAFTALAMPGDRERCLAAGMDDYISKPIRMAELHARLLELWAARRETNGPAGS